MDLYWSFELICNYCEYRKNCGRGKSLWTTTCLKTPVMGKHWHTACKVPLLDEASFLCPSNFIEIIKRLQSYGEFGHPRFLDIAGFTTVVSVCCQ